MNYWLLKTEPETFGWQNIVKDKKATWDGVRNYAARNNLREMKTGDLAFMYHSVVGKEVVGIMRVIKESYPDPTTDDKQWLAVDFEPVEKLSRPVTLSEIKSDPELTSIKLIKYSRLSVMPLEKEEFDRICFLGQKE
ncbi:MAG: EVE domain-containing protein [Bacteroidota bacterium]|nr:EVE domain-containing protein [Bacteroidota bacterium]